MALNRKGLSGPYTHWTHNENDEPEHRRFHKVFAHFDNGPGKELKGSQAPYSITTHSGNGFSGQHEAHLFYETPDTVPNFHSRRRYRSYDYFYEHQWLSPQNITNVALAIVILGLLRLAFVGSVLGGY